MTEKQIGAALRLVRECQSLAKGDLRLYNKLLRLGSILVKEQRRNVKIQTFKQKQELWETTLQ